MVVVGVEVAFNRRQNRRFEVLDRAFRGLAVHELRVALHTGRLELASLLTLQADGHDLVVSVQMLNRRVL